MPLLGRERELAEIRGLVTGGARLLTLTGAGGSGKTRLALQAAAELAEQFLDRTFFVALAPLRDANAVLSAVAESVGLQPDDIAFAADPAAADRAAQLRGAVARLNSDADVTMNAYFRANDELERHLERELVARLGDEAWEREKTAGSTLTLEQAIELARSLSGRSERAVASES